MTHYVLFNPETKKVVLTRRTWATQCEAYKEVDVFSSMAKGQVFCRKGIIVRYALYCRERTRNCPEVKIAKIINDTYEIINIEETLLYKRYLEMYTKVSPIVAKGFAKLDIEDSEAYDFKFAVKRKGPTSPIVKSVHNPDMVVSGRYVYCKNEEAVMHLRLLLGDNVCFVVEL